MTVLGSPDGNNYETGSYPYADGQAALIEEGRAFQIDGNGKAVPMAAGGTPSAVAGFSSKYGTAPGSVAGNTRTNEYGVYVQVDDSVATVTAEQQLYVIPASGKFTNVETDNIATGAVVCRSEIRTNGIVNSATTPRRDQKCVKAKFIGGL